MNPNVNMQPGIILLRDGTDDSQGKAQLVSNINACQAVAEAVRTTLGPRGMDKLIHDGTKVCAASRCAVVAWLSSWRSADASAYYAAVMQAKRQQSALFDMVEGYYGISLRHVRVRVLGASSPFALQPSWTLPSPRCRISFTAQATISNDGAKILQLLDIVHPAAKTLVDIARAQDAEIGDGTTTVTLLAAEFLKAAKPFVEDGVHPQIIIRVSNLDNATLFYRRTPLRRSSTTAPPMCTAWLTLHAL